MDKIKSNSNSAMNDRPSSFRRMTPEEYRKTIDKAITNYKPNPGVAGNILMTMTRKKHEFMTLYMDKTLGEIYDEMGIPKDLLAMINLADIYMELEAHFIAALFRDPEFLDYDVIAHFKQDDFDIFCIDFIQDNGHYSDWLALTIGKEKGIAIETTWCHSNEKVSCSPFKGKKMSDMLEYMKTLR